MAVDPILTERLELLSLSRGLLEALADGRPGEAGELGGFTVPAGWPDAHDADFLLLRARDLRSDPGAQPWLVRAVVLRAESRPMVGHAGFHGPPGINAPQWDDAVEVGYSVFEPHRGRGYATEAVRGLVEWARDERGVRRFVASIAPGNAPSLAVVRKLGFREIGRHWDEADGLELEFELNA